MVCHITFLVSLVIRTNHFLQGLEEDAESMELSVAKSRGAEEGQYPGSDGFRGP